MALPLANIDHTLFFVLGIILVVSAVVVAVAGLRFESFPPNRLALLTTATSTAAGGGGSTVKISADPSGQLAFQQKVVTAPKAGPVTIDFTNDSPLGHDVHVADSSGKDLGGTNVITGASTSATVNLKPGKYTFFCSVPGHEAAGMKGTLTVK